MMMGIRCALSAGYNCVRISAGFPEERISERYTLGFHTRTGSGPSSMGFNITGCGHVLKRTKR